MTLCICVLLYWCLTYLLWQIPSSHCPLDDLLHLFLTLSDWLTLLFIFWSPPISSVSVFYINRGKSVISSQICLNPYRDTHMHIHTHGQHTITHKHTPAHTHTHTHAFSHTELSLYLMLHWHFCLESDYLSSIQVLLFSTLLRMSIVYVHSAKLCFSKRILQCWSFACWPPGQALNILLCIWIYCIN